MIGNVQTSRLVGGSFETVDYRFRLASPGASARLVTICEDGDSYRSRCNTDG
jgi:hypothetical protein